MLVLVQATSFLQATAPAGAGRAVAAEIAQKVMAMPPLELTQIFFGIQLGGAVASDLPCNVRRDGRSIPCNWRAIPCNIIRRKGV